MGIWDNAFQSSPSGAKALGVLDDELRALKSRLRERILHEFYFDLSNENLQFIARPGIAKAFVQVDAPTARPDGQPFTEEDAGRIWIKHEYGGSPSISQPIGMYFLVWASGTYSWRRDPNMAHIGALEFTAEGFTNPSGASPYTSGTRPGWVLANGAAVIAGLPNPAGWVNVPNYADDYAKFGTSPTATGGNASFALTTANLPPHSHGPGTLTGSLDSTAVTVSKSNQKVNTGGNLLGSATKYLLSDDEMDNVDASNGTLSITGNVASDGVTVDGGFTGDNDAGSTFVSDPVDLDPKYRTLVAIVRMY